MENTELTLKQEDVSIDVDDIDVAAILDGKKSAKSACMLKCILLSQG